MRNAVFEWGRSSAGVIPAPGKQSRVRVGAVAVVIGLKWALAD
jgi:hypothetical protein